MDPLNVLTRYAEGKLSSVAWCTLGAETPADQKVLATGSWDGDVNRLSFWAVPRPRRVGPFEAPVESIVEPANIVTVLVDAAVTKLVPLDAGFLCMADAGGSLTLLSAANPVCLCTWRQEPQLQHKWDALHHHGPNSRAACNSVAVSPLLWATVGDDGRLHILDAVVQANVRVFGADGVRPALSGVVFQHDATILTANSAGQLQMWDPRAAADAAVKTMRVDAMYVVVATSPHRLESDCPLLSAAGRAGGSDVAMSAALHSLAVHPHQPTAVLTGGADGILGLWDTRHEQYPRALKQAHTADVWDVQFHPLYPDNVFTAGEDGALLHWDTNPAHSDTRGEFVLSDHPAQLVTTNLIGAHCLGVNSVAVDSEYVACGTDNEALLVFTNIPLK